MAENNNENEKILKQKKQFRAHLNTIHEELEEIDGLYDNKKKKIYDPILIDYQGFIISIGSSSVFKEYDNKNFKINTLREYISSEYNTGLNRIDEYNTIIIRLNSFKGKIDELKVSFKEQETAYESIGNLGTQFKNMNIFAGTKLTDLFTQVEEKLNSIDVDKLIADLTAKIGPYLTQLRINIMQSIVKLYNTILPEKIAVIDTTIAEMNANNVNSKKSLDIILRANTGVVAQILLLKGILNSVKSAISNTSSNTKNKYSNSEQIQTAVSTAITTLVQTYKNMESEKVKSIQNTYTATVKKDISKLDGELKTKKDELKTVLSTLSNSSLGNRYPSKEILLELSSQIDGLLITTTEKNILDKLAKVIKEINDRLSVSDNGPLGNNQVTLNMFKTNGTRMAQSATGNGEKAQANRNAVERVNGNGNANGSAVAPVPGNGTGNGTGNGENAKTSNFSKGNNVEWNSDTGQKMTGKYNGTPTIGKNEKTRYLIKEVKDSSGINSSNASILLNKLRKI
jgi:hypothetical protein